MQCKSVAKPTAGLLRGSNRGAWLLVFAAIADSLTFIWMGIAHEANPLVAAHPVPALAAKAGLTVLLLAWSAPIAYRVRLFGAVAWTFGACTNVAVLLAR